MHPLKREFHTLQSSQDCFRQIGTPSTLKKDNARTQTENKWADFERQSRINDLMTEPNYPW